MAQKLETQAGNLEFSKLNITHDGQQLEIAYFFRPGKKGTILYVHGIGCSKNDFLEAFKVPELHEYALFTFDFPGCGDSPYPEKTALNIGDLVKITISVMQKLQICPKFIIGHSMGGVVGLLLSEKLSEKIQGFVNIEGNLGLKDCYWSRKVITKKFPEFQEKIFPHFKEKLKKSSSVGGKKYAEILEKYSSPKAYFDYSYSLVEYSDNGNLLDKFLNLKIPKIFVYGSENAQSLAYLKKLKNTNCNTLEISDSNHFPFYDNPIKYYEIIVHFIQQT